MNRYWLPTGETVLELVKGWFLYAFPFRVGHQMETELDTEETATEAWALSSGTRVSFSPRDWSLDPDSWIC